MDRIAPIHPGEILKEEFLEPMGISQYRLAKDIKVSPMRINEIVNGKRGISINTAFRLAKYFNISIEFWTGLQTEYDIAIANEKIAPQINLEVRPFATPAALQTNV